MPEGEDWVSQYHAGAGESHHFPYAGAHLGFVAMDFAFRARGFAGAVRAFFQPLFHVFHQGAAVLAQVPAVAAPAEHLYHDPGGLDFVLDSFAHDSAGICIYSLI
jgi:hypothetical protein